MFKIGLDNGIVIKTNQIIYFPPELVRVSESWSDGYNFEYDLCYWRKCWNIRRAIGMALGTNLGEDAGKMWLDISDVKNIWHVLNHLNHKRVWDEGDSIWSYKEIRHNLDDSLLTLEWLIDFMRKYQKEFKNGDMYVEFYDSY